ncbi:4'-phosphopantetheinyl transferase family protein [Lewinella sp. IMCC34191]|uniref:4'-phosphopantetheinyl transferase family protein n=1 Tax=Lewinella sp. IMCC34191 TaxID=2259172 RepID=UPI000E287BB7|nr:4'-phosphopantetheinyl transferase superfamily protein [Lewinella sp. IMCC34191]
MPLFFHESIHPPGEWGLWRINESEQWLRRELAVHQHEECQLQAIRGEERRREFLAARLLLHEMSGRQQRGHLIKDTDGKPHLEDSLFFVSISHTVGLSAAMAHPHVCGIDVQRIVPRITHLAPKFVSEDERPFLLPSEALIQLHLIWSAKEAMYKAYGRRQLDFKEHLFVNLEGYRPDISAATGVIQTAETRMEFSLDWKVYADFVLVAAVEV